jgi:putative spermidine/putrescine transport system permease protein
LLTKVSLPRPRPLGRGRGRNFWGWLVLPGGALLVFFFVWPLGEMVAQSFTNPNVGFGNYSRFFSSHADISAIFTTFEVSALVTLICAVIGYCYAYTMVSASPRVRSILMVAVMFPAGVSLLVRIFAIEVLIQDVGPVNEALKRIGLIKQPLPLIGSDIGTSIGMVSILLPYMVLPMYAVMRRIDREYLLAASSLGANPVRALLRVYFPMSLPGVLTGSLIVFVSGIGYYIVPSILGSGSQLFMGQLVNLYFNEGEWGYGSAIAVVLLGLMLVVLVIASRFTKLSDAFGSVAGE